MGYEMTRERDEELVLCHSEQRKRPLPHIGKLAGAEDSEMIWIELRVRDNVSVVLPRVQGPGSELIKSLGLGAPGSVSSLIFSGVGWGGTFMTLQQRPSAEKYPWSYSLLKAAPVESGEQTVGPGKRPRGA